MTKVVKLRGQLRLYIGRVGGSLLVLMGVRGKDLGLYSKGEWRTFGSLGRRSNLL